MPRNHNTLRTTKKPHNRKINSCESAAPGSGLRPVSNAIQPGKARPPLPNIEPAKAKNATNTAMCMAILVDFVEVEARPHESSAKPNTAARA